MSDCCKSPAQAERADLAICKECTQKGRTVQRITPDSLLKPEPKAKLGPSQYYWCPNEICDVVYFSNVDGVYFFKTDLTVRVGQKESEDPIPVCYCFGHTRQSVWDEIRKNGKSTAQADISAKVKAGLCRCEVTNPQGSCCLGNVAKAVQEGFAKDKPASFSGPATTKRA